MSPETLLKCARKAYPHETWELQDTFPNGDILPCPVNSTRTAAFTLDRDWPFLQIALEREGWMFKFGFFGEFEATRGHGPTLSAKTKPELLAACVESTQE